MKKRTQQERKRETARRKNQARSELISIGRRIATHGIKTEEDLKGLLANLSELKMLRTKVAQLTKTIESQKDELADNQGLIKQLLTQRDHAAKDATTQQQEAQNANESLGISRQNCEDLEKLVKDLQDDLRQTQKRAVRFEEDAGKTGAFRTKLQDMANKLRRAEYDLTQAQKAQRSAQAEAQQEASEALQDAVSKHRQMISSLVGALQWCATNPLFKEGGANHEGWQTYVQPVLDRLSKPGAQEAAA